MRDWFRVFGFTFRTGVRSRKYLLTTLLVALAIIAGGFGLNVLMARHTQPREESIAETEVSVDFNRMTAGETPEAEDDKFFEFVAPYLGIMILYFMLILYGMSVGHTVSQEKTNKLMEYMLTLTGAEGIVFGKVLAIVCEAAVQLTVWLGCGAASFAAGHIYMTEMTGGAYDNFILAFLAEQVGGGQNIIATVILTLVAFYAAFLFYCMLSALFASFAATADEVNSTNSIAIMILLAAFLVDLYVPMLTDSAVAKVIVLLIPFTGALILPGTIFAGSFQLWQSVLFLLVLCAFMVPLVILAGRVYRNRLFKTGVKNIFSEIIAIALGKETSSGREKEEETHVSPEEIAARSRRYELIDNTRSSFNIVGLALLIFMLAGSTVGMMITNAVMGIDLTGAGHAIGESLSDASGLFINNIIGMYCIAFPISIFVLSFAPKSGTTVKRKISVMEFTALFAILYTLGLPMSFLGNWLADVLSGGQATDTVNNTLLSGGSILAAVTAGFIGPVVEELVFRKFIIDRTRQYGEAMAIIYSAVVFGLFHGNFFQSFYATAMGLVLGYVYVRTGNIFYSIMMHIINNCMVSFLAPYYPEVCLAIQYVLGGAGLIALIYMAVSGKFHLEADTDTAPAADRWRAAIVNPGTCMFVTFMALVMAYTIIAA